MIMDFGHGSEFVPFKDDSAGLPLNERLNNLIDSGLTARESARPLRDYLGASRLGEPCMRKLGFEATNTPVDPGREFTGRTYRIFQIGHQFETMMVDWLRVAGFTVHTAKKDGSQFGFKTAGGRIAGHIDGVIAAGPDLGVRFPIGWENKSAGDKGWKKIAGAGLRAGNETYYGQIQIYCAYMDLPAFLFTCINKNDEAVYAEMVPFDKAAAQALSDKAVQIIRAIDAGEKLPRIAANSDFYLCRWCSYQDRCWSER